MRTRHLGTDDTHIDRVTLLRETDPDAGRELLEAYWEQAIGGMKLRLMETMSINLSLRDEAFLEARLDDRLPGIRKAAKRLLEQLPQSHYLMRMAERAMPLLYWDGKALHLQRPQPADASTVRDLVEKPITRDSLTIVLVGHMPPPKWLAHLELSEAAFIQTVGQYRFGQLLWQGLVEAAHRFHDTQFADAMFNAAYPQLQDESRRHLLLQTLSPQRLLAETITRLAGEPFSATHSAIPMLMAFQDTWTPELADVFLFSLWNGLRQPGADTGPMMRSLLEAFAYTWPLRYREALLEVLAIKSHKNWQDMVDTVKVRLAYRAEMLEAIHG
jgi:hypothetical protein